MYKERLATSEELDLNFTSLQLNKDIKSKFWVKSKIHHIAGSSVVTTEFFQRAKCVTRKKYLFFGKIVVEYHPITDVSYSKGIFDIDDPEISRRALRAYLHVIYKRVLRQHQIKNKRYI